MFFEDIETERLILKVISAEDDAFILKQFSNDEVNRYLFDVEPYSKIKEAQELIQFYNEPDPRNQNRWIMVNKDTGEKMGTCGFHCWDRGSCYCELGYDLYPVYWKKGYMQEALKAILTFAKNEMKIKRMETHIAEGNIDSVKTSEKQGFKNTSRTYMEHFRGKDYLHYIYEKNF